MKPILLSLLTGTVTLVVVFQIARKEPLVYGLIFGAINALVVYAVFSIAKASDVPN